MVEEATFGELDLPLGVGSPKLETVAGGKVVLEVAGVEVSAVELLVRTQAGGQQAEQDNSATHHCHHHCSCHFYCNYWCSILSTSMPWVRVRLKSKLSLK